MIKLECCYVFSVVIPCKLSFNVNFSVSRPSMLRTSIFKRAKIVNFQKRRSAMCNVTRSKKFHNSLLYNLRPCFDRLTYFLTYYVSNWRASRSRAPLWLIEKRREFTTVFLFSFLDNGSAAKSQSDERKRKKYSWFRCSLARHNLINIFFASARYRRTFSWGDIKFWD